MSLLLLLLLGCGKDAPASGWTFEPVKGFEMPPNVTDLIRRDDALLALDLSGQVVVYDWDGSERGSFQVDVFTEDACGLISLVFDPDYDSNGLVYFGACESATTSGIYRAHLDLSTALLTDRVEVLLAGDPTAVQPWHNIGWLGFAPDGALIGLFGDKTNSANGADTSNPLSSAVRIFPNKAPGVGGYTPHPDNPFAAGGGHDAVMAWGFRSPWTGAIDPHGGLWVGDVGSNEDGWEEVNRVQVGASYGWPEIEGGCTGNCGASTPPVEAWPHKGGHPKYEDDPDINATVQRVAWLSIGHDGVGKDPYNGAFDGILYGDLCLGWVRHFDPTADGQMAEDRFVGHLMPSAWVQGPDGYLYASQLSACGAAKLTHETGFFRLVPTE